MGDELDMTDQNSAGAQYTRQLIRLYDATVEWARHTTAGQGGFLIDRADVRATLAEAALAIAQATAAPGPHGRNLAAESIIHHTRALFDLIGPAALISDGQAEAPLHGLADAVFRYAPGTAIYGGTTDVHRNLIAEQHLGLPRSTPRG